ncbi:MAG: (d)CMP kinase [Firmicutes bacterium]|jgi:cytidylate kinase|nr:(d)CMP kinase [Candidatus Fermentithermobacillaceae bacterium]
MECKRLNVAIDGPAGAGKSTVARLVANSLGYTYFDTGAMYRALAVLALDRDLPLDDFESLGVLASQAEINGYEDNGVFRVWISGKEITDKLREPETDRAVAMLSMATPVRKILVSMQQQIAKAGGVVMEGRDITSVVMPDAEVKVFLTADVNERARRRWQDQVSKGIVVSFDEVLEDLIWRDAKDLEREWGKLVKVDDAEVIDSTNLSIDEVCEQIIRLCKEKQECST